MTENGSNPSEDEVRALLLRTPLNSTPDASERDRIAQRMWDEAGVDLETSVADIPADPMSMGDDGDQDRPSAAGGPDRARNRVLLWAAMVLAIVGIAGLALKGVQERQGAPTAASSAQSEFNVGGIQLSFTRAPSDQVALVESDRVELVSSADVRQSQNTTIARPTTLFAGQEPDVFFQDQGISAEVVSSGGVDSLAQSWLISLDGSQDCAIGESCVAVATLSAGQTVDLEVGGFYRLELHDVGEGQPLLVLGTASNVTTGPILTELTLES